MKYEAAFKDILVHVDDSRSSAGRLEAALRLAAGHGAHLVGLFVIPTFSVPVYAEAPISEELFEEVRQAQRQRAEKVRETFDKAVSAAGVVAEWREIEGDVAGSIVDVSRYCDLVVLGQTDPEDVQDISAGVADRVVMESGRPALVIPYVWRSEPFGRRVLVAWNGSREAVRAVSDAMPLLQRADNVEVLTITSRQDRGAGDEVPTANITLHLARHGVKAEANAVPANEVDTGNRLLSKVSDDEVDLIVMGAYGHSRFRELVLGGVTRFLLNHMTVPVFMSH